MLTSLVPSETELNIDVAQLAAKLGVTAILPKVLEMTRSVFPEARIEVEVEYDPEIADEVCLAIVVRSSIEDPHELVLLSSKWHQSLFESCPPYLASAFRLNTDWRP